MTFESWDDVGPFIKRHLPDLFTKRSFNFITIHYLYMIGMTLLFSVILYVQGGMHYIDSLFFAAGACTQSGLNTVDVDLLHTGQQAMLYLPAMLCNPIAINSFVVFVRLYWFEKRFKDIVKDSQELRRSKSRRATKEKEDPEAGGKETGVRGRAISVLRETGRKFSIGGRRDAIDPTSAAFAISNGDVTYGNGSAMEHKDEHKDEHEDEQNEEQKDERRASRMSRKRSDSSDFLRIPEQVNPEQHIRFLEMQRNPSDSGVLYIPGPREFERGERPEEVEEVEPGIPRRVTSDLENHQDNTVSQTPTNVGHHITINEPTIHRTRDPHMGPHRTQTENSEGLRSLNRAKRTGTYSSMRRTASGRSIEQAPYLSYQPTVGRNSFFLGLSERQREELGGIEYRALKTLALVLVCYFFLFHLFGLLCLLPWIARSTYYRRDVVNAQGQGWPWWAWFTAASAFNDLGFTLTNNSMISFQYAVFPLLVMTFLIIIGNTGFPCMLRFVIWVLSKIVPVGSAIWEELRFLLDHPRRCFTLLFPRAATWWLFAILVILNGVDLIFFIILDLNDSTVTSLPPGLRFLNGLFQAASTRTAGFASVNIADLHPAIQVSYMIMMYISVFPIAISMRRTNVYEEKSLGVYASAADEEEDEEEPSYVGAHLRRQLSFDLWYVFMGLFIVCIVEGHRIEKDPLGAFTIFACLFEIVSAYGTVGLSLGYPTINASFSAEFKTLSKLVVVAMMIRGRHRGLPYALDRAILLPSDSLHQKEAKESERIMDRQRRRSSIAASSTLEGQLESTRFRPETGLATGHDHEANTYGNDSPEARFAMRHVSRARSGLGNAMFKLASAPDAIKEEGESGSS